MFSINTDFFGSFSFNVHYILYFLLWSFSCNTLTLAFFYPTAGPRCDKPLGMKNGRIHANQITASSMWDRNHGPSNARLHWRRTRARTGAWSSRHNNHFQWLLVDFKRSMRVVKIAIQGRQDARQWVTKFFVSYSQDGAHFAEYKENSNRKVCIDLAVP